MAMTQAIQGRDEGLAAVIAAVEQGILTSNFSKREQTVLTIIFFATLRHPTSPRFARRIPGLRVFTQICGISKGNLSEILGRLKRCLVITEEPADNYAFRLPVEFWKVPLNVDMRGLDEFLDLEHETDDLQGALRATLLAPPARASGRADGLVTVGVPESGTKLLDRVPESGTADGGSRIGNRWAKTALAPCTTVVSAMVPESGTAPPFKALKSSGVSTVKSFEPAETFRGGTATASRRVLTEVQAIVGTATWTNWGGAWVNLVKRDQGLVERIVAEYHRNQREGGTVTNPGGWMWDLAKRWR